MNEDVIVSIGFILVAFLGIVIRFAIPLAGIIIGCLLAKRRNNR